MTWLLLLLVVGPPPALAVTPGDVIIDELMLNPGSTTEWVELRNRSGDAVDLLGCRLETDAVSAPFRDVTLRDGAYGVVARGLGTCPRLDDQGDCASPPIAVYDESIDLLHPDREEELRLVCQGDVIDSLTYSWATFAPRCYGRQLCSVGVRPGAADNHQDWAGSWCISAPADAVLTSVSAGGPDLQLLGSPGLPNGACAPAPCERGDVLISELMIAPPSSYLREYVELAVPPGGGCDLQACALREGPFPDATHDPLSPDWDESVLHGPGNVLPAEPGDHLLIGNPEDPNLLGRPVDVVGLGISLADNDAAYLHLVCGATVVDSAPYDSDPFELGCAYDGCAVNLPASQEVVFDDGSDGNDRIENWCLAGAQDSHEYTDADGDTFTWSGTPGEAGRCEQRAWPQEGELVFTELLISPQNGDITHFPEFFEMHNTGPEAVDLVGCTFERTRVPDADGAVSAVSYTVPADGPGATIEADGVGLFTRGRCIDGADPADGPCTAGEIVVGALSFTEAPEDLSLRCPDGQGNSVLVDTFRYDASRSALRPGRALVYDGGDAAGNDEPGAWCEAATDECYAQDDRGRCNYGTPGILATCRTDPPRVEPSGPGARCSAAGGGGALFGALGLVGLLRRRRRG